MPKQRPSSDGDLNLLINQAEHYAKHMMRSRSASVPATLMALNSEGYVLHLPNKFANEADKEKLAQVARLVAIAYKASAIAMISEAWVTIPKLRGQKPDLTTPPSESPDREEVVVLMAEARGASKQRFLFIQRDSAGRFTGFGTSLLPDIDKAEGRFSGLMPLRAPTEEIAMQALNLLRISGVAVERIGDQPGWN